MQANLPPNNPINNVPGNPPGNVDPKISKKKLKQIEKQNKLTRLNEEYKRMPKPKGQYIIPPVIHYTKIIKDEGEKNSEKVGELYIQYNENNPDDIELIKTKYNIDETLFIDTGQYKWPDLDSEKNLDSKQEFKKEKEDTKKSKDKKKPVIFKSMTFDTILESLKKYKKIIPEKYHYVVAISNISITEFLKLQELYKPYSSMSDQNKILHNLGGIIADDLKKSGVNPDNIPDIQSKVALLGKAILNLKKQTISDSILIPDIFSAFIIIYYLILNKSFWMLFSEKNHGFLTFIIERCFEFIDQDLNDPIPHSYDKIKDTKNFRDKKSDKVVEATKNKKDIIKFTNKELMSEILVKYFNYPKTPEKPTEQHIITNLQINNLDPSGENIVKIDEKSIINDDDDKEIIYKLKPNRQFINDNSLANKFNKVPQDKINHIFSFFAGDDIDNNNLAILLLSTASKGLIQYLFISGLYVIFNNKESATTNQKIEMRKNFGKKSSFKDRHIISTSKFQNYLKSEKVFEGRPYVQELSSILKINIHKQVNDYYSGTGSIYEKFLKYIWEEYKTVSTFKSIFT